VNQGGPKPYNSRKRKASSTGSDYMEECKELVRTFVEALKPAAEESTTVAVKRKDSGKHEEESEEEGLDEFQDQFTEEVSSLAVLY
jgi:hypothetical protein